MSGSGPTPPIVAPFWADLRYNGGQGGTFFRVTDDMDFLSEIVNTMAEVNPEVAEFLPREAVIVTWFNPIVQSSGATGSINIVSFYFIQIIIIK